jgi:hypothetical protein
VVGVFAIRLKDEMKASFPPSGADGDIREDGAPPGETPVANEPGLDGWHAKLRCTTSKSAALANPM